MRVHAISIRTKVVCSGVKVLFWWGAGEGQASAQAAVVYHHIQQSMWRHHLHHWVQRPNCQVRTVLQRLPHSDDNTQAQLETTETKWIDDIDLII